MAPEQARDSQQASLASDMYSLGATQLFAATGHPPDQGDTVMDVLVKLATEPPDLTGLPGDLVGLVTACLAHSPRDRPTSAALLAGLGPFVEGSAGPADGHTYLPESAMSLISSYARSPQPGVIDTSPDDASGDEPTSASHTALPSYAPTSHRRRKPGQETRTPVTRTSTAGMAEAPPTRQLHSPRDRGTRIGLITVGCVAGAVALVAAGAYLGPKVDPSLNQSTTSNGGPPPLPPSTLPTGTSTTPKLVLSQGFGDGVTGFEIHGMGFVPGTKVNVLLVGHGTSSWHPEVDPVGTFNYTIDQDHRFFHENIPVGKYEVLVTGSGGRHATAKFQVSAPPPARPAGPPPTGTPPAGAPPTGQPPGANGQQAG
jgi:serine/threonine protein kinase